MLELKKQGMTQRKISEEMNRVWGKTERGSKYTKSLIGMTLLKWERRQAKQRMIDNLRIQYDFLNTH